MVFKMHAKTAIHAVLAVSAIIGQTPPSHAQGILENPEIRQLQDQDIDANSEMLDALRVAARKGPIFRISPSSIKIKTVAGTIGKAVARITNTGDETGQIAGLNPLGSISGLKLATDCPESLPKGKYCDVSVSYGSPDASEIRTVIVGTINERFRSSFEIPVEVSVSPAPVAHVEVEEVFEEPEAEPNHPATLEIALSYLNSEDVSGRLRHLEHGFTIVSYIPKSHGLAGPNGLPLRDTAVLEKFADIRYDSDIPHANSGLPVNQDNILTADRVIKAILETPISSLMCGKAVAMVESDIYSSTSRLPLIRAGSKVIGECREFAGERAGIEWNRIINIDGRSINFKGNPARTADAAGLSGVSGRLYRSTFDTYTLPILSTVVDTAAGAVLAAHGEKEEVHTDNSGNRVQQNSAKNEGLRIATEGARENAQYILDQSRDTREVAIIAKGTRIDIELHADIYFPTSRRVIAVAGHEYAIGEMMAGDAEHVAPRKILLAPSASEKVRNSISLDGRDYNLKPVHTDAGSSR